MATRFVDHFLDPVAAFGDLVDPATVPQGSLCYVSDDHVIYRNDGVSAWDAWVDLSGAVAGDVATDTIWQVKGDLAVASAADAAAVLGVGSDGDVLTADSGETLGMKWAAAPSSGGALIFSQVLGSPGTTLDTGALAIPGTFSVLEVWIIGANTAAGFVSASWNALVTFNGDAGAHYDQAGVSRQGATTGGQSLVAQNSLFGSVHPASGTTAYPGVTFLTIPLYAGTTFNKAGTIQNGLPDATAANQFALNQMWGWRSTAAINQITAVAGNSGNWLAGSAMYVFGR